MIQYIHLPGTLCLRILTVVIVLACAGERGEREEAADDLVSPEHTPMLMPEMPQILWADTLRPGETLAGLLADQGLTFSVADRISAMLGVVQDLKACKPGAAVTAYGQTGDEIERITYDRGEDIILISLDARNDQPTVLTRNGLTRLAVVRGEVDANLYSSMIDAGAEAALVMAFADIFAWEIDFLTEVRQGDLFCVVFHEPVGPSSVGGGIQVEAASYRGMRGDRIAIRYAPCTGKNAYFDPQGQSLVRTFLRSPLNFKRISSGFSLSRMHPIHRVPRPHLGVDYAAPAGTPVVSVADGTVISMGWDSGFGKLVRIRHAGSCETQYGHLSRYGTGLRTGASVSQGQVIGYVGSTGIATGSHLDFRFKKAGRWVNPLTVESPREEPLATSELTRFTAVAASYERILRDFPYAWCVQTAAEGGETAGDAPNPDIIHHPG